MKKTLLIIATLFIALPKAKAFEPIGKNEISTQFAYFTGQQITSVFKDAFVGLNTFGDYHFKDLYSTGLFKLQYHHAAEEKLMYGISVEYEWSGLELKDKDDNPIDQIIQDNCFSILGSGKLYLQSFSHFGMYMKFQAGIQLVTCDKKIEGSQIIDKNSTKVRLAFQAIPLGLEFGGRTLRGFVELGVGTQGIWSIGVKKQF